MVQFRRTYTVSVVRLPDVDPNAKNIRHTIIGSDEVNTYCESAENIGQVSSYVSLFDIFFFCGGLVGTFQTVLLAQYRNPCSIL